MRIRIPMKEYYSSGGFTSDGGVLTGPLILSGDPTEPLGAATKSYVDNLAISLNASNITTGTILINRLPAFSGDVRNLEGSNSFVLDDTIAVQGTYSSYNVDAKGRVSNGGGLSNADIPDLPWNKIISGKPTTSSGYGILDAVNPAGDVMTGALSLHSVPVSAYQLATKSYVDSVATNSAGYSVGDTIRRVGTTTPTGFLRCNGGEVGKTTYAGLYAVIGDTFSYTQTSIPGNGKPWRQQYQFNKSQNTDITGWVTGTSLPATVSYSQAIVTNSRVYLLGGVVNGSHSSTVYTAPINSDGTLGSWTTGTSLPVNIYYSQAIVTNSRVYLLGGHSGPIYLSTVYTALINSDGTLGTWTTGTSLPVGLDAPQAIVTNSRVYLLGGVVDSSNSSAVYTAPINSDGTLGTWTTGTSLPATVSYPQAIVTNSRVYLLGGIVNGSHSSTVYTAPINSDGTLGSWTTGASLPGTVYFSQAIVTNSRVYLLGGVVDSSNSSAVYTAPINSDGTLGTWTTGTSLPATVSYPQAIVTNSRVYLLGGYVNGGTSNVYTASFSGGLNDYSPYYNGTITVTPSTSFRLPDTTLTDKNTLYTYIKY